MTENHLELVQLINKRLEERNYGSEPKELYDPIRYIMSLGGKRMRPLLVLLAYKLFKDDPETVVDQALAVEVFHNFTLVHDDIMDNAPLRRGKATVHEKWDANTAILSGDVMMVKAYDMLLDAPSNLKQIVRDFNACAAGVCEGQQLDMNFETLATVDESAYINMIRLKTAVLLGFSLKLGAMLAQSSKEDAELLYDFGVSIGIGFQLKDDLLDVYGDQTKFGKQVGGDIISNKKTFLLLKALELANEDQRKQLDYWLGLETFDAVAKVEVVRAIYDAIGIEALTKAKMNEYFDHGFSDLEQLGIEEEKRTSLKRFAEYLIDREH
ncbi:polyprenyl synthetase family protein [Roseivirga echinicomitans]|uniref:Isoprenyl synthetase n=1 Tax=Roseivirga echinicomitans TaxID=296218 RepID=A0A150XUW6_9BACT|nr:polyprenyl synthetase family protein [Roseivirga echinicomitans]KYG82425.1 isoprenyl synthetase [Roseivirga echinicomitans]